jgi:hypothetical protein
VAGEALLNAASSGQFAFLSQLGTQTVPLALPGHHHLVHSFTVWAFLHKVKRG